MQLKDDLTEIHSIRGGGRWEGNRVSSGLDLNKNYIEQRNHDNDDDDDDDSASYIRIQWDIDKENKPCH